MNILVTNHTVVTIPLDESGQKTKATVVIPQSFYGMVEEATGVLNNHILNNQRQIPVDFEELAKPGQINELKASIAKALTAKEEIKQLQRRYDKDEKASLKEMQKDYLNAYKSALSSATITESVRVNDVTGVQSARRTMSDFSPPVFTYVPTVEVDKSDPSALGPTIRELVFENELDNVSKFDEAYPMLDKIIDDANKEIAALSSARKFAFVAGVEVPVSQVSAGVNADSYPLIMWMTHYIDDSSADPDPELGYPVYRWRDIKLQLINIPASRIDLAAGNTFQMYRTTPPGDPHLNEFSLTTKQVLDADATMSIMAGSTNDALMFPFGLDVTVKGIIALLDGELEFVANFTTDFTPTKSQSKKIVGMAKFTPTPKSGTYTFVPPRFGVKNLGIADYRRVEQEVCCYEPGEVSHIENIMAREYKEKSTERSRVTEITETSSFENETENLTDTSTTTRNEMNIEIASIMQQDMQIGINGEAHFGNTQAGGSIGSNFGFNTSSENSTTQALSYAQEVTQRATDRIVSRVRSEKISKVIESYKESNKHGFDNTQGEEHVSGVYRWINKVYSNQLVNYGKRAMIEFMIPEPARFHILASEKSEDDIFKSIGERPIDPRSVDAGQNRIENYRQIMSPNNPNAYIYWASKYGVETEVAPPLYLSASKGFTKSQTGGDGDDNQNKAEYAELEIPEGYFAKEAFAASWQYGGVAWVQVIVAQHWITLGSTVGVDLTDDHITNTIPVTVAFNMVWVGTANVLVRFERTPERYQQWQNITFNAIIEAYEVHLEAYEKLVSEAKNKIAAMIAMNPLYYRQIERNALKKNIMHYLVAPDYIGQNYILNDTDVAETVPRNDAAFDANAAVTLFMEQAFEWNIISYNFYPFYWGSKSRWHAAYNYNFSDPLFTNFMQAGMARVIVSVRPGFEKAVNWYMATGQVWNGGEVPTLGDDLFLSLDQEMQEVEPTPEGLPWKTKLPSDLTVIQSSTIGLLAQGLPCGCPTTVGGEVHLDAVIEPTNTQIGGPKELTVPPVDPEENENEEMPPQQIP